MLKMILISCRRGVSPTCQQKCRRSFLMPQSPKFQVPRFQDPGLRNHPVLLQFNPFGYLAPKRIPMLRAEESEMTDTVSSNVRWSKVQPLDSSTREYLTRRSIVPVAPMDHRYSHRAQCATVSGKICQRIQRRIVEEIVRLHDPIRPFQEYALGMSSPIPSQPGRSDALATGLPTRRIIT